MLSERHSDTDQALDQKMEQFEKALHLVMKKNDDPINRGGLTILQRIGSNIIRSPRDKNVRALKRTNRSVFEKFFSMKGNLASLIKSIGFVQLDRDHYEFQENDLTVLGAIVEVLSKVLYDLKLDAMTQNERDDFLFEEMKKESKRKEQKSTNQEPEKG